MNFSAGQNFGDLVGVLVGLINLVIPVLSGAALVLFLYGGVRFVMRAENAKGKNKDKDILIWGIVALFVMVSVWGILRFFTVSFLDQAAPASQTSTFPAIY